MDDPPADPLDKLLIALRDGGTTTAKGKPRRAWSARSLNKAVDAWRGVLAYGVECRELSHNVAASMKKVPRVRREMATYTPDEIGRLLRAADKGPQRAPVVSRAERPASRRGRRAAMGRRSPGRWHCDHREKPGPGGCGQRR